MTTAQSSAHPEHRSASPIRRNRCHCAVRATRRRAGVLGPERLPGAIRWAVSALRQARDYVSGATSQLRDDLGPEFDELRQPFSGLQKLRGMSPRAVLTHHLSDDDDSLFTALTDDPDAAPAPRQVDDGVAAVVSNVPHPGGTTPFHANAT